MTTRGKREFERLYRLATAIRKASNYKLDTISAWLEAERQVQRQTQTQSTTPDLFGQI